MQNFWQRFHGGPERNVAHIVFRSQYVEAHVRLPEHFPERGLITCEAAIPVEVNLSSKKRVHSFAFLIEQNSAVDLREGMRYVGRMALEPFR